MIDYRNNNKWTVYIHTVPKELSNYEYNKYYVGITSCSPKQRWLNGKGYQNNKYFNKAINKYGWNNIEHEIIAKKLTENEAKEFEVSLISVLNSNNAKFGYNLTKGGDSTNPENCFIVAQYDLEGNFIAYYESMREARRKTNITIDKAVHGMVRQAGGYQWKRFDKIENIENKIEKYIKPSYGRIVNQYDLYGNFIKKWNGGTSEIYKKLGFNISGVAECCNGNILSSKEYQWRWENSNLPLNNVKKECGRYRIYYRYTKDGKFIDSFLGKDSLRKKFGIHKDMVTELINNIDNNSFDGYRFTNKYYESLPPLKDNYTKRGNEKNIYQYDFNGNLIDAFSSNKIEEKADELNIKKQSLMTAISKCSKDIENNYYKGYRWTREYFEKLPPLNDKKKYYFLYDVDGNLLYISKTITELFKKINCNNSTNNVQCKFKDITNNFYYGYRWTNKYYEKLPLLSKKGLKQVEEYERKIKKSI